MLTTEDEANAGLYEHHGYRAVGSASAGPLPTWLMPRRDTAGP